CRLRSWYLPQRGERRRGREEDGTSWDHPRNLKLLGFERPAGRESGARMRRAEANLKTAGPPDARYMRRGLSTVKVGVPKRGAECGGTGRTIRVCRLTKRYLQGWPQEGIDGRIRSGACAALPRSP